MRAELREALAHLQSPRLRALGLAIFVLLLSVAMCSLAAIFSARRLRAAGCCCVAEMTATALECVTEW